MDKVIEEIAAERRRQIAVEGWTAQHDDEHDNGELARAAACYALGDVGVQRGVTDPQHGVQATISAKLWPWEIRWWKPKTTRRNLIRAAAMLVAEIERLDRLEQARGTARP